jgi:hypothetical protein
MIWIDDVSRRQRCILRVLDSRNVTNSVEVRSKALCESPLLLPVQVVKSGKPSFSKEELPGGLVCKFCKIRFTFAHDLRYAPV